ncbi:MAG: glycosyltransferase family 2 protein [Sedimentisphaerales bacterium]|nr:glycosyltransferase family 2 protein [Sedimentisphaerales bacterium]
MINKEHTIKISVVMPAYNIEGYIGRAIKSVLAQTRPADEIIVVDDGSTDGTAAEIKKFGEQVRYIHQENAGLAGARNTGIKAAHYEWITFLDGDDEWLSEYLEQQTKLLQRNQDLRWSYSNFICCLCNEKRRGAKLEPRKAKALLEGKEYFDNYFLASRNKASACANTTLIRREVFEQVGFFREDQTFAEDVDMWWRIAFRCPKVGYVAEPLAIYHMVRPGTLTESFQHSKVSILTGLLERHLKTAAEHHQLEQFESLASDLVTSWIRALLFEDNAAAIQNLLERFGYLVKPGFRAMVRLLIVFPRLTAGCCHTISRVVRFFKLRRRIIRRPARSRG